MLNKKETKNMLAELKKTEKLKSYLSDDNQNITQPTNAEYTDYTKVYNCSERCNRAFQFSTKNLKQKRQALMLMNKLISKALLSYPAKMTKKKIIKSSEDLDEDYDNFLYSNGEIGSSIKRRIFNDQLMIQFSRLIGYEKMYFNDMTKLQKIKFSQDEKKKGWNIVKQMLKTIGKTSECYAVTGYLPRDKISRIEVSISENQQKLNESIFSDYWAGITIYLIGEMALIQFVNIDKQEIDPKNSNVPFYGISQSKNCHPINLFTEFQQAPLSQTEVIKIKYNPFTEKVKFHSKEFSYYNTGVSNQQNYRIVVGLLGSHYSNCAQETNIQIISMEKQKK